MFIEIGIVLYASKSIDSLLAVLNGRADPGLDLF
jgi:hypothetical protein